MPAVIVALDTHLDNAIKRFVYSIVVVGLSDALGGFPVFAPRLL
jgi:hypothetical protein